MGAENKTRILILGGGFGGVATAQGLAKRFKRDRSVEITLVNRDNHFVFVPLLVSAAAGSIETLHAVSPIRRLIPGVNFRAEEVINIDLARRVVTTTALAGGRERQLGYDHLVLALGNVVDLSRLPGVAEHGRTIKTLGDALAIRNHVLSMLEAADIETDPVARREMLTFVVAGGGFSGVEMAGELNDLVRDAVRLYPSISRDQLRVILLHSQGRILPEMTPDIADYGLRAMRARGVEVRLGVRLKGATPHEALLEGGMKISTRTLIVAVGNAAPPVLDGLHVAKERGKVVVDEFMAVGGHPGVWALGDNAIVPNRASKTGDPSPPTAQYALRQGKALAHNIAATMRGRPAKPFSFSGLGLLCLVGHGAGVGQLPLGIKVRGRIGWFMWRGVYWSKTPSLGRKVQIGFDWFLDLFLPRDTAQISLAQTRTIGRVHYEAGEYIFRQGETGNHFYLIAEGEVEVMRERSSGAEDRLARLGKGEYFGETALLTDGRRNATVRTVSPVDLITLGREDFAALAGTWLQFAESLRGVSEERAASGPATTYMPALDIAAYAGGAPRQGVSSEVTMRTIAQLRRSVGGEVVLDRDLISLGRSSDNHVVVPDPTASRRHALIQREGDAYYLEDLGGSNGTFVNSNRVSGRAPLQNGDVIRIGAAEMTFALVQEAVPPEAPTGYEVESVSITNLLETLDGPDPNRREAGELTRMIQRLDLPAPAQAQDQSASITGMIRSIEGAPQSGPVTSMIQGLDVPQREAPAPDSIAGIIQELDARNAPRRAPGPVTSAIEGLDAPRPPVVEQPPSGRAESAGVAGLEPAHPVPPPAGELPANRDAPGYAPVEPLVVSSTRQTSRLWLRASTGPLAGNTFEVGPEGAVIGRLGENDIHISDGRLSRRHARIEYRDGEYWLADLGSSNGTLLNGTRLAAPCRLQTGDVLGLGATEATVTLESGVAG